MDKVTEVQTKAGDSLTKLAEEYLQDYSQWREIAYINNLDIFQSLPIGINLKIPNKEDLKTQLDKAQANLLASATQEASKILNEIAESRAVQEITKILGVDTTKLLEDLDLSSLAGKLPKASDSIDEAWNLIDWIL